MNDPDLEWLMTLDASYIKAHPHSAGARGGSQGIARTKRGLNSKLPLGGGLSRDAGQAGSDRGYGCRLFPGFASD